MFGRMEADKIRVVAGEPETITGSDDKSPEQLLEEAMDFVGQHFVQTGKALEVLADAAILCRAHGFTEGKHFSIAPDDASEVENA